MQTFATAIVGFVFADLPYGVTKNAYDVIIPLTPFWAAVDHVCVDNAAQIFSAIHKFGVALCASNLQNYRYDLIWQKSRPSGFLAANKAPLRAHEQLQVFFSKQPTYNPQFVDVGKPVNRQGRKRTTQTNGGCYSNYKGTQQRTSNLRFPISVQQFLSVNSNGILHPAQKPVALLEWLIKTYTNPGDTVLDPVMGSGTTGVACKRLGRHFIGIEKDENYFYAAKQRIDAEPWPELTTSRNSVTP